MKKISIIITTLLLMLGGTMYAHGSGPEKNNYLVLTQNIGQLGPILMTAHGLAKEDGGAYGQFSVIICGRTVQDIVDNKVYLDLLDKAAAEGMNVFVCGISLEKFKVSPTQLPKNLMVKENGILFGLQLVKNGFHTLTL